MATLLCAGCGVELDEGVGWLCVDCRRKEEQDEPYDFGDYKTDDLMDEARDIQREYLLARGEVEPEDEYEARIADAGGPF